MATLRADAALEACQQDGLVGHRHLLGVHHYSCACNELHAARITRDKYGDLSRKGSSRRALSVKSRQAERAEPC
jgi:hypothetical protein